jgi:hypothetical protein
MELNNFQALLPRGGRLEQKSSILTPDRTVWKMDVLVQILILLAFAILFHILIFGAMAYLFYSWYKRRNDEIPEDVKMEYWKYNGKRGKLRFILLWTVLWGITMSILMGDFKDLLLQRNISSLISFLIFPLTGLIIGSISWHLKEQRFRKWNEKKRSTGIRRSSSLYKK